MRRNIIILLLSVISFHAYSIERNDSLFNDGAVVTNSFWDNWYGEIGGNMSLFNPYGSNIRNVVPKGMSFGIGTAELTWWVSDKLFGPKSRVMVGSSGNTLDVTYNL